MKVSNDSFILSVAVILTAIWFITLYVFVMNLSIILNYCTRIDFSNIFLPGKSSSGKELS